MRIDNEKSTAKYLQLKAILLRHFQEERYRTDQRVPTENDLIERFAVSRNTVRQALTELTQDGVIYKIQGSGSFFAGTSQNQPNRSFLVGVIVPRLAFYIYPKIIQGIDDVAHQKQYNIVLGSSDVNPEKELVCINQLVDRGIDGLLIEPSGGFQRFEHSRNFHRLKELSIPVVFMDWAIDDPDISYVSTDDEEGGFRATNYLIAAGHRRIACFWLQNTVPGLKRHLGYKKALETHGITYNEQLDKSIPVQEWQEPEKVMTRMRELLALSSNERPTAIFFFNDDGALHGYDAIREAGLKVPDDLSVIGFDDSELALRADVPLTTMIHPKYQLGKWAAEILFEQIEHGGHTTPNQMILNPRIAVRKSVRKLH